MTETVHIENAVLGGGEAGKYVAWTSWSRAATKAPSASRN